MLLSGCGASFLTQSKAIVDGKKSYSKILVVSRGKNEIARSLLEQDIAKELKGHGVNAVAYHKESGIGVPVDVELSEQQVAALWRRFYTGVSNPERHNPRLRQQFMPKRYWPYLTEMQPA